MKPVCSGACALQLESGGAKVSILTVWMGWKYPQNGSGAGLLREKEAAMYYERSETSREGCTVSENSVSLDAA